ncbi:MAG: phosphomethylpyrimidine synthase ThiC, partial [Fimbriimonadales bacterium]
MSQTVTQMHYARSGVITDAMRRCAEQEQVDPELIRTEVARGRAIIPANIHHHSLKPIVIGKRFRTKVNANIGSSALDARIENELEKLRTALRWGADTVMDLSTAGDLDAIRTAIIQHSPAPVGTVPVYQLLTEARSVENIRETDFLDIVEHQAQQGVDYMTIHAGVLRSFIPLTEKRLTGIVSRGGAIMA